MQVNAADALRSSKSHLTTSISLAAPIIIASQQCKLVYEECGIQLRDATALKTALTRGAHLFGALSAVSALAGDLALVERALVNAGAPERVVRLALPPSLLIQ